MTYLMQIFIVWIQNAYATIKYKILEHFHCGDI